MKFLLTNDDGIDAPGLDVLERAVREWGEPVVVAPAVGKSGVGHQVTTDRPIPVEQRDACHYSVEGMPADCVRIGLTEIVPDASWVLAGVNRGANLGADVYISGTVAAAREGALLGCRALAISQYVAKGLELDWEAVFRRAAVLLGRLLASDLSQGEYWNANMPHSAEDGEVDAVVCPLDTRPLGVAYRKEDGAFIYQAEYRKRPRQPGRDVDVCLGGRISVTRLVLDIAGSAVNPDPSALEEPATGLLAAGRERTV
ncbi:MAG: 5'/3'-nucleotidase SurE [Deltaproteobacteria bacterium]|nr:5'/3'-nucleotidase SurE [Deltaproteobacteria bacterium]